MNHLKTSLILNRPLQSWVTQWGHTGRTSTPKLQADTHVGSLGALRSWESFVTRVALKCKGRSPGCAQGDAPGQGEQPGGILGWETLGGHSPQLSGLILF